MQCFGGMSLPKSLSRNGRSGRQSRSVSLRSDETAGYSLPEELGRENERHRRLQINPGEVLDRITAALGAIPAAMTSTTDALVNLSFLERKQGGQTDKQGHLLRRVSSVSQPSFGPTAEQASKLSWTVSRKVLEDTISQQAAHDLAESTPDLRSEEARLRDRLKLLKLDMHVMQGDGNCQFRSVSFCLYGTEDHHGHVRRKAIEYMRQRSEEFEMFLGEEYPQYLGGMERSRTWGDELTLRAIAEVYNLVINVITSTHKNWFLRYSPSSGTAPREVFLTYISPLHYNAVRRRSGLAPLRESFKVGRQNSQVERAYLQSLQPGSGQVEAMAVA